MYDVAPGTALQLRVDPVNESPLGVVGARLYDEPVIVVVTLPARSVTPLSTTWVLTVFGALVHVTVIGVVLDQALYVPTPGALIAPPLENVADPTFTIFPVISIVPLPLDHFVSRPAILSFK